MAGRLLWRGMLAGLVAALLAGLFAFVFAEPLIDRAIAFEATAHALAGEAPEPEVISRGVQKTAGLLTAMLFYGAGLGGVFALVFAGAYGRIGRVGPRTVAIGLAVLAFVVIILVPAIKYPPNPPAVGQHETIKLRTAAYFGMVLASIASAAVAAQIRRALLGRLPAFDAAAVAIVVYVVVVGAMIFILPAIDEVPRDFRATLLWQFRLAALGTQTLFWLTLGWLFGRLATRVLATSHQDRS